jgi:hypothetical protein
MENPMTKKRLLLVVGGVVIVLALMSVKAVRATPPVSWKPEPFDVAVPPGGELSTKVTAVVSQDIPATKVEVTGGMERYVTSIQPVVLPALTAGSEVTIALTFRVATGTSLGTKNGTLQLKRKTGGPAVQARPLPLALTVGTLRYPPDPGEAGKETLEGIDSDSDGVRDDIQRYIEINYADQGQVRSGLRQYARSLQDSLLDASSQSGSVANAHDGMRARECLRVRLGSDLAYDASGELRAFALNTESRSRAYILFNGQLGGEVFDFPVVDRPESCQ